jgi:hypothetical protein
LRAVREISGIGPQPRPVPTTVEELVGLQEEEIGGSGRR